MNNIYVEGEFLNHCNDCPFYNIETEVEFVGYEKNYHKCLVGGEIITGKCPLKSLSDRLAEERKKVVQSLKDKIEKRNNGTRNGNYSEEYKDGYSGCCCDIVELLDQIERGG